LWLVRPEYGLNRISGIHGWQLMFLVEGLLASVVGVYALWYLVDKPQDATWITPEEKHALAAELDSENESKPQRYTNPWMVFLDPRLLFLSIIYFTVTLLNYGIIFYLPTQISELLGQKI
jgi:sugar phosphate permease